MYRILPDAIGGPFRLSLGTSNYHRRMPDKVLFTFWRRGFPRLLIFFPGQHFHFFFLLGSHHMNGITGGFNAFTPKIPNRTS